MNRDLSPRVTVLAVSPREQTRAQLRRIFATTRWMLGESSSCLEAMVELRLRPLSVVLCEDYLPDGSWKDLLDLFSGLPKAPLLVVTSRNADEELWMEVLDGGGYDCLAQPFDPHEVTRVLGLAWREAMRQASRKGPGSAAATLRAVTA